MDPSKLLEADHRIVEDLLERIEEAEESERSALVEELTTSLSAHMALEEEVFYPAMEPVTGEEMVVEGVNEHNIARKGIEDLVKLAPGEPGFEAALEVVKTGISHHVEDEESEVFPKLRQDGQEQLAAMEERFMARRAELGLPMDAATVAENLKKQDLLEEAKAAGVSGAASMTKEQLAEALTEGR